MNDRTDWIKSSYSDGGGGNCVEWAPRHAPDGNVPVRDSKDTTRAPLTFPTTAWAAFVHGVRHDTLTA